METAREIECIDRKIGKIKHMRNVFNTNTKLSVENMTVDEALVYMAILNKNFWR